MTVQHRPLALALRRAGVRAARTGLLLWLAAASPGLAAEPTAPPAPGSSAEELGDPRARARDLFEQALSWAREGRYAEARLAFLRAYAAHPHYLVLYNVAQCELQLHELRQAAATLERFLREGENQLQPPQRAAVEAELAQLRERIVSEEPARSELPSESAGVRAPLPTPEPAAVAPAPAIAPPRAEATPPQPTWGWYAASGGVALLGSALGVYLYDAHRYQHWKQQRAALDAFPNRDTELARNPQLWAAAKQNNERLATIHKLSSVAVVLGGTGAAALGVGLWKLFAPPAADTPSADTASARGGLQLGAGPTVQWQLEW